jgi:hypothetical protein
VTGQRVMVRRDSGITTLAQLSGKRVVTVKGGSQEANLRKNEPALKATVSSALRELEDCGEAQKLFLWFGPGTALQYPTRPFRIDSDRIAD